VASGSHVLVCGLGQSGIAAARLLRAEGSSVIAVDERNTPQTNRHSDRLSALGCTVHLGVTAPPEGACDLAVTSPGLDVNGPFLSEVRRRGIPLISELELGWSRFKGRTVAVTGSNGKSSVVKALADCFSAAGVRAVPCGNYGLPVCQAVLDAPEADWLVIEVSSFQLETCVEFRPDIGVLLNVLPNHLDRHGAMETYADLKARLFACQREGDAALTPSDWNPTATGGAGGPGRRMTFGAEPGADFRFEPGRLIEKGGVEISISGSYFANEVLGTNAAALLGAARAAGLSVHSIQRALGGFVPLPHRAQPVGEHQGVLYVDDSKATNLSAMMASIRMQPHPVWLIAGGRPKESDFSAAVPLLKERVKGALLIGEAASAMAAAWSPVIPCTVCDTLECAVKEARSRAAAPEVVLLAPACTSYDQFPSYVQRGEAFQKFVSKKG
jgi:UDP-N-acetylmuramoylalanine--D-glutamate ligase